MKKTTQKDFEIFKQECQKWIDRFELSNFEVHYVIKEMKDCRAECYIHLSNYIATIALTDEWNDNITPLNEESLKVIAKHEVIHLFLGRLASYTRARYVTIDEVDEAEHEIVRKLEKLIT